MGGSAIKWVIDDQMTPMGGPRNEIWAPATDTPPTTAQNAVNIAVAQVGLENIYSTIRVRYVLFTEPHENGLKNHPMWVVQMDRITWTFSRINPVTGVRKTAESRAEFLIDANTGKSWEAGIGQIST